MPRELIRGFPLTGDVARFRGTEQNIWVVALIFGLNLLGLGVVLLVLLPFKNFWILILGMSGIGGILFYIGYQRKTTWRVEIKRSVKRFQVDRNGVPQPPTSIHLNIVKRGLIGYALVLCPVDGPAFTIAASKERLTIEVLHQELQQYLVKSASVYSSEFVQANIQK